jgi:hypothetical protein
VPFTSSHPAAILPLAYLPRKYVCMTGLIIGSTAPDFEYFFRMATKSDISHTTAGIFLFCLPLGILLSFLFHNIVRDSLIDNLPLFLKARFCKIKQFNWNRHFAKRWFITAPSVAAGAWSHIFWDSFTHGQYKIYQHPSTVIGAVIILFAILKIPKNNEATGKISIKYWAFFTFLTALILFICALYGLRPRLEQIGRVVTSTISASLISITLTSLVWKYRPQSIFL